MVARIECGVNTHCRAVEPSGRCSSFKALGSLAAEALHVLDGDAQQLHGLVRPGDLHNLDERHHVLAVGALGVTRLPPGNPGFENVRDRGKELLDALADGGRGAANQDGGQVRGFIFGGELGGEGHRDLGLVIVTGRNPGPDGER